MFRGKVNIKTGIIYLTEAIPNNLFEQRLFQPIFDKYEVPYKYKSATFVYMPNKHYNLYRELYHIIAFRHGHEKLSLYATATVTVNNFVHQTLRLMQGKSQREIKQLIKDRRILKELAS